MRRRSSLIVLGGAVAVVAFHAPIRSATLTILRAPFKLAHGAVKALLILPRLAPLAEENTALRAELSRQSLELAQAREALRRLSAAQTLLAPPGFSDGVVASVIGRSPLPGQQTVWLDRGRRHGVRPDAVLVDAHGVAGRLVDVHETTSLALLITDPNSRIASLVERSRASGLLVGQGRGVCRLIYLDADADVVAGDRVVTAGFDDALTTKGLWLGTVLRVVRDHVVGSATAMVRPAAQLSRLEEVRCLIPSAP